MANTSESEESEFEEISTEQRIINMLFSIMRRIRTNRKQIGREMELSKRKLSEKQMHSDQCLPRAANELWKDRAHTFYNNKYEHFLKTYSLELSNPMVKYENTRKTYMEIHLNVLKNSAEKKIAELNKDLKYLKSALSISNKYVDTKGTLLQAAISTKLVKTVKAEKKASTSMIKDIQDFVSKISEQLANTSDILDLESQDMPKPT